MKRILHALAALWGRETEDRRVRPLAERPKREDRKPETEDRRRKSQSIEDRKSETEVPVNIGNRRIHLNFSLLRHAAAVLRMDEIIQGLAVATSNATKSGAGRKPKINHEEPNNRPQSRSVSGYADWRIGELAQPNFFTRSKTPLNRGSSLVFAITILFMCLTAAQQVSAQAEPADAVTVDIKPLQIGDTIPEYLWHLPLQVVNHPEGKEAITLNDYRGKLIILDFWGTFCGSCIAAMPKIDEVQQRFSDNMVVIPVSWSKPDATEQTLQTHRTLAPLGLSSVVDAKTLIDVFPHGVVPHYAWIDPQGRVVATTATNDVTHDNIAAVLKGEEPDYALKTFIDTDSPILFNSELLPKGAEIQQYSVFIRGFVPSLGSGTRTRSTNGVANGHIMQNRTLANMYQIIASRIHGDSIMVMGNIGKKRYRIYDAMDDDTVCTFDFIVPAEKADSLYQFMLTSLNQHSGYIGQWVSRKTSCLVLSKTGSSSKFMSRGQGKDFKSDSTVYRVAQNPISRIVGRLNWEDISNARIVIDETGYDGDIDITLHAPFDDFANVRRQLNEQGLDLIEAEREVDIFEIRKNLYK